jgi:hypothetical protein
VVRKAWGWIDSLLELDGYATNRRVYHCWLPHNRRNKISGYQLCFPRKKSEFYDVNIVVILLRLYMNGVSRNLLRTKSEKDISIALFQARFRPTQVVICRYQYHAVHGACVPDTYHKQPVFVFSFVFCFFIFLLVRLSVHFSVCQCIYLSLRIYVSISLSVCLSVCLSMSVWLSIYLSACLLIYLPACLFNRLSVCISACVLSLYLAPFLCLFVSFLPSPWCIGLLSLVLLELSGSQLLHIPG